MAVFENDHTSKATTVGRRGGGSVSRHAGCCRRQLGSEEKGVADGHLFFKPAIGEAVILPLSVYYRWFSAWDKEAV